MVSFEVFRILYLSNYFIKLKTGPFSKRRYGEFILVIPFWYYQLCFVEVRFGKHPVKHLESIIPCDGG
jgi:hypothetical protein